MSTQIQFGNKKITEPGVYSRVKSGIKNPPQNLSYGNVLLIDTGIGAGFGSGSGIDGFFNKKKDSIQSFNDIENFRSKVRGGEIWDLAKPLFQPAGFGVAGVSNLYFIKAATTTPSTITYTFLGGGTNGGTLTIKSKNEGICGNGVLVGEKLATSDYIITGAGTVGNQITLQSTTPSVINLGSYTTILGDTTNSIANGLVSAINLLTGTHGYTATSLNNIVSVKAPIGTGALANNFIPTALIVGTITATVPLNFSGGVANSILAKGFAGLMKVGPNANTVTPDKFVIEFWTGNFKGIDNLNSTPWDGVSDLTSIAEVLVTSNEFSNINEFISWAKTSARFNEWFELTNSTISGSGLVNNSDLIANLSYNLATLGTETYSAANLKLVLDSIKELDYTFCLVDNYGVNLTTGAKSANNLKILNHILEIARFQKYMVVAGGYDENEFNTNTGSVGVAEFYNSSRVIVCHGGIKFVKQDGSGFSFKSQLYKTASILGRICGLAPEVPVTFKNISMDADVHEMTDNERILALQKGVLHTKYDTDFQSFIINQGITSTQKNINLVNEDGSSHEISVERIAAQLNKQIEVNAKIQLFGQQNGVNRGTLSTEIVKNWLKSYLLGKTATTTKGGLITYSGNYTVSIEGDAYFMNYEFEPNFPVNKLFFTGLMIDRNLTQV